MRALFLRNHHQPNYTLLLGELSSPPAPLSTQVHIRVHSFSISSVEAPRSVPTPPATHPSIPGHELSGTVLNTGNSVTGLQAGDKVACVVNGGAWAEEVVVEQGVVGLLPGGVGFEEGAVVLGCVMRALEGIRIAAVAKGERVLVGGGGTSDGVAVAWVVKRLVGGSVVAVVEGAEEADIAKKSGADTVIDRHKTSALSALNSRVRVAFDCRGEGGRIGEVVQDGGIVVRLGDGQGRKGGLRNGVEEDTARLIVEPEKVIAAMAVIRELGVRVPFGPRFGVREFVQGIMAAEASVGTGKVVVMF